MKKTKKKDSKTSQGAGPDEVLGNTDDIKFYLSICDAPRRKAPKLPDDEIVRRTEIARRYNQGLSREHNHENWKLQLQLDLKSLAMDALPADQLAYAQEQVMEDAKFPLHFRFPTWTPPIKGYRPEDFAKKAGTSREN
eukprot:CAMPEP_0185766578 /NCGR_PEP_ID=MMETSP1174-20130828/38511_1 /TAXON_ID=35687 /ORGANISM="Dictyocha speculum, Strain CCMP1381" /LENGTH=137 /DNA_ID=CAMNT_0028450339 /DNA_START=58 /DNA_END=471 /DNA_ORIENTATION=-